MTATMPLEVQPFQSHASLRIEHSALLKEFHQAGEPASYAPQIRQFIQRGVASGAFIDMDSDRQSAQSVLDYWGTRLYRLTSEDVESSLVDFDPDLAPDLPDELCPYVGLEAFVEEKQAMFFGRSRLAASLVERLKDQRILIVVGSSGSGKSSIVRAGLLPAMKRGGFPPEGWDYPIPIVPGSHPDQELSEALEGRQGRSLVITVDQFEEVFTLCLDDQERSDFVQKLISMSQASDPENRVILTLRTDFVTQMTRLPELNHEEYYFHVPPLNASELREAIQSPAERIGLKFDEGIVDALLNEILGEPAALPLLQFSLLRLWENREHNRITWTAYKRLGGGRKALETSATEFYKGLIPEHQVTAKQILLRMVRPGEGLEVTSNRVQRKELYAKGYAADRIDLVLEKFIKAHLLRITPGKTREEDQIEVAHEALIRNWSTLVEWLEAERERLRERRRLTTAAELWQQRGQDAAILLRGALLEEAAEYDDLNDVEAAFMQASLAVKKAEDDAREAARLREIEEAKRIAKIATSGIILAGSFIVMLISTIAAIITEMNGPIGVISAITVVVSAIVTVVMSIRITFLSLANVLPGGVSVKQIRADTASEEADISRGSRLLAAISYLHEPIALLALVYRRKSLNRFVRFHALQSVAMFFISTAIIILVANDNSGLSVFLLLGSYILIMILAVQAGRARYARIPLLGGWILKTLDRKKKSAALGSSA
ncbi:MAG: DUF4870 domain-containing protein [Bacteroidota bacterium]